MEPKTKRQKISQAKRERIVEAAITCFVERGFHQTSIRDIAGRADISLGNLYNHFKNKEELIQEIAALEAAEVEELKQKLLNCKDPVKALDQFIKTYMKSYAEPVNALLTAEVVSEGLRNPAIRADFLANRANLISALAEIVEKINDSRGLALRFSPHECAGFLVDLVEGYAMRLAFVGTSPGRAELSTLKSGVYQLVGIAE